MNFSPCVLFSCERRALRSHLRNLGVTLPQSWWLCTAKLAQHKVYSVAPWPAGADGRKYTLQNLRTAFNIQVVGDAHR